MPQFGSDAGSSRQLERRSGRRARGPAPSASPRQSQQTTPATFKQILIKYLRRQARYNRTFSLAVLDILEYEQVKKTLGPQAAQELHRLAQDVLTRFMRDADRLCGASPGQFLLLLPDTDAEGGRLALERLAQCTAQAKSHYHHKHLRPSCSFRMVDSGQYGSDPEILLDCIGFAIDEDGQLSKRTSPELQVRADLMRNEPFNGSFSVWSQRYESADMSSLSAAGDQLKISAASARDLWRSSRPVQIRILEAAAADATFEGELIESLARRLRVLQSIDHPGVVGCIDYHLKERRSLYLVQDVLDGPTLTEYLSMASIDSLTVLDWALQICNSIIYLQGLMPPVVPSAPSKSSLIVSADKHLVLTGFEIQYLFPAWHEPTQISGEEIMAVNQGRPVPAFTNVITGFAELIRWLIASLCDPSEQLTTLFARMGGDLLPADLNTVYKLRSALKRIWDWQRLQAH